MSFPPTLLIAYGNPGRGDDGLGPAFAERIAAHALPALTVDIDYQLTVDHVLMISRYARVIFADATLEDDAPFYFRPVLPRDPQSIGSHSVTPEAALALCRLLFAASPAAFVLGLSGHSFGTMSEVLSAPARARLDLAEAFFLRWYRDGPASVASNPPARGCGTAGSSGS